MPRPLRVEFPGAVYHVMNRGDRREAIFLEDADRHDFLRTLAEACRKKTGSKFTSRLIGIDFSAPLALQREITNKLQS